MVKHNRRTRHAFTGLLLALTLFMAPAPALHASADQWDNQIAALNAQITGLRQQLTGVGTQQAGVANAVLALQQHLASTETRIATTQTQLNSLNTAIAQTIKQVEVLNQHLATDKQHLSQTLTSIYEMQNTGYGIEVVLNAPNFFSLAQSVVNLRKVNASLGTLAARVQTEEDQLTALQAKQQAELAQEAAAMSALQTLKSTEEAQQVAYQREASALTGQASSINSTIAADQAKIVELQAEQAAAQSASQGGWVREGNALRPFAFGARFDAFPWGQCTWYVASLRNVSWTGDAWAWAGNARAQGYSEGMTPRRGAIVVWGRGNGYSWFGHVAYVVAVTSNTTFIVDEGNYLGLGVVDQRDVTSLNDVEAFIY